MLGAYCRDCPRRCGAFRVLRRERGGDPAPVGGFCGAPFSPVLARAGLHFWEEPVLSGSRGSGAVFFSGCNLRCRFCQNYDISARAAGEQISVHRLRQIYAELIAQGAHNINLVTPTHYVRAVAASLRHPLPVPVIYNSNGYELPESLALLRGKIAIYLPDLKYADDTLARDLSGAQNYFRTATAAIQAMYDQVGPYQLGADGLLKRGVIIRHLALPGQLENSFRVIDFVAEKFRPKQVLFSLMFQYLPQGPILSDARYGELHRKLVFRELKALRDHLFSSGIEDGFIQSYQSAKAEYIPKFDGTGVLTSAAGQEK